MPKKDVGKTGTAPIIKQGHTSSGRHGDNPDVKRPSPPRELKR
jgi:hypothetical protein